MAENLNFQIKPLSVLKFALPTIIANVFMCVYMMVDGIFVANCINTDALSAVNIVMPFVMIVLALGTMTGTGGSAIVSALLGEKRYEKANEVFSFLCLVCFVVCCGVSLLSLCFRSQLVSLLGANEAVFDYCIDYATPLFFIAPFALVGMAFQSFFISAGKPALGMIFSITGGITNIFLDWLLIAKLSLGTAGAALATGIGYTIPGIAGIIYFSLARKGTLHFVRPRRDIKALIKTITNGSSEMVAMMSSGITTVIMNNIVMKFAGEDGVAAISILIYAMSLLTSIYMGYSLGVAPVISFNHGAQNRQNLKKVHKINLIAISVSSALMYLTGFVFRDLIISIFAREGTFVYQMASEGYLIFSISFLYMGFNMYASSLFTALGDGKTSAVISFCRGLVFLIIALYTLSALFGLNGLFAAMPVAEALGLILSMLCMKKFKEKYGYA